MPVTLSEMVGPLAAGFSRSKRNAGEARERAGNRIIGRSIGVRAAGPNPVIEHQINRGNSA